MVMVCMWSEVKDLDCLIRLVENGNDTAGGTESRYPLVGCSGP